MAQAEAGLKEWVPKGGPYRIFNLGPAASPGGPWLPAGKRSRWTVPTPASP